MAAVRKRQSMTSSTATAAGGTSAVPRSTSQPGNCRGGLISYRRLSAWFLVELISVSCVKLPRKLRLVVLVNYLVLVFYSILLILGIWNVFRCVTSSSFRSALVSTLRLELTKNSDGRQPLAPSPVTSRANQIAPNSLCSTVQVFCSHISPADQQVLIPV